ncbi:MAG TPA: sensor histidine kinase [candidate division Zixibacteria bacterium]|nr:sensor histidine kinase [candidate division Zixibacteria bacterium]
MAKNIWAFDLNASRIEQLAEGLRPQYELHSARDVNDLPPPDEISALIIDPDFGGHFCEAVVDFAIDEAIPVFVWSPIGEASIDIADRSSIRLLPMPFAIDDVFARLNEALDDSTPRRLLAALSDDILAESLVTALRRRSWRMTRAKSIPEMKAMLALDGFDAVLADLAFVESAREHEQFAPRRPIVVLAPFENPSQGAVKIDEKTALVSSSLDPDVLAEILDNVFASSAKIALRELSYLKSLEEAVVNADKNRRLTEVVVKMAKDETLGRRSEELNLLNTQTKGLVTELFDIFESLIAKSRAIHAFSGSNELSEEIFAVEEELARAKEVFEALRAVEWFKRIGPLERIDMAKLINHSATKVRANRRRKEIVWDVDLSDIGIVTANPQELEECFINIFTNSYEAIDESGIIEVKSRFDGFTNTITIRDTGVGMSAETLARVTRAYFTTKSAAHAGLGLTIARGIVKYHGGELTVSSTPGEGTVVEIKLPSLVKKFDTTAPAQSEIDLLIVAHRRTVGFIEAGLIKYGHRTEVADNIGEAVQIVRKTSPKAILVMAGLGFLELDGLRMLIEAKGDSKLILLDPTESIPRDISGLDSAIKGTFPLHHLLAIVNSFVEAQ